MTRLVIGSYPTPLERVDLHRLRGALHTHGLPHAADHTSLFVKQDGASNAFYGGNKVRKLELLLGAAHDLGRRRILTVGAAGSHQVVATAILGRRHGFEVEAVLVPQPRSPHAERNLQIALAHGLSPVAAPAWALAPALVASRFRPGTYFIPLGGSNALGSMGFVDAAQELAAQVTAGAFPEPDIVVLPVGSGGTAAGLAVGFERLGLRTRIVAASVSHPSAVIEWSARRLARKTGALAGLSRAARARAAMRIDVEGRWVGRGYGHPTRAGRVATEIGEVFGLALEPTYTAKAFACALAHVRAGQVRTVLFWHTLSTVPLLASDSEENLSPLPPRLARLFR